MNFWHNSSALGPWIARSDISFDKLNELSNELILKTEQFYFEGKFENYTPYTTSYGISLNNIEEAISFNNIHEGLHLGYMMALSKNL